MGSVLAALACVAIVAVVAYALFNGYIHPQPGAIASATVVRVVDGDTLVVDRAGSVDKVRLKGVDTPESVHPDASRNTEAGKAASDFTASTVPAGSTVWLQADSRGDDSDAHGRLLRYVWLSEPDTSRLFDAAYVREHMLEGVLLSGGYAEVYAYGGEMFDYRAQFEAIARGL